MDRPWLLGEDLATANAPITVIVARNRSSSVWRQNWSDGLGVHQWQWRLIEERRGALRNGYEKDSIANWSEEETHRPVPYLRPSERNRRSGRLSIPEDTDTIYSITGSCFPPEIHYNENSLFMSLIFFDHTKWSSIFQRWINVRSWIIIWKMAWIMTKVRRNTNRTQWLYFRSS